MSIFLCSRTESKLLSIQSALTFCYDLQTHRSCIAYVLVMDTGTFYSENPVKRPYAIQTDSKHQPI